MTTIRQRIVRTLARGDMMPLHTYSRLVRQLRIVARAEGKTLEQVHAECRREAQS